VLLWTASGFSFSKRFRLRVRRRFLGAPFPKILFGLVGWHQLLLRDVAPNILISILVLSPLMAVFKSPFPYFFRAQSNFASPPLFLTLMLPSWAPLIVVNPPRLILSPGEPVVFPPPPPHPPPRTSQFDPSLGDSNKEKADDALSQTIPIPGAKSTPPSDWTSYSQLSFDVSSNLNVAFRHAGYPPPLHKYDSPVGFHTPISESSIKSTSILCP